MIVSDTSSAPRTLAPSGTHIARCVQVIDLGTQDGTWAGKPKVSHKVRITWELPYELFVFDPQKGEQPFYISRKYTVSLGEQSSLRKDLESWRGRPFTEDELRGFDLNNILGAPCQVTILHKIGEQSKKLGEVVSAITPLAKGMNCPAAISPLVSYEVDQGRNDVYRSLPKFTQEDIAKCHEWRAKDEPDEPPADFRTFQEEPDMPEDNVPF